MNNKANRTRGRVCTYIKTFFIYIFHLLKHILFIFFTFIPVEGILLVTCSTVHHVHHVLRPQHDNTTTHERRTHTPCRLNTIVSNLDLLLNKVFTKIIVKV